MQFPAVLAVIAITLSIWSSTMVYSIRGKYHSEALTGIGHLPSSLLQISSLEFKSIVADLLFLKTITYLGQQFGEKKNPDRPTWHLTYLLIDRITDLDKAFWDPYLFAEMTLPWQADMIDEANQLMLKASTNRPNDYRPLYFIAFNHFFFRKDLGKASQYLRQAALRPGIPFYLQNLAARLSLYGNETVAGISLLEEMIQHATDKEQIIYLAKRQKTLKIILHLEEKIAIYRNMNQRNPNSIQDLVTAGLIEKIPADPYGGEFYLFGEGKVYTTSKMVDTNSALESKSTKAAQPHPRNAQ